MIIQQVRSFNV